MSVDSLFAIFRTYNTWVRYAIMLRSTCYCTGTDLVAKKHASIQDIPNSCEKYNVMVDKTYV